jgi:hypothetical protein
MSVDPASEGVMNELGERLERLLGEVRGAIGPQSAARLDELVHDLVTLYGAGLARLVAAMHDAGVLDAAMCERLANDELVASLLLLHDLHPFPVAERIRRALARLEPEVGSIVLVSFDQGLAKLRATGAMPPGVARAIEQVVQEAAPEVTRVELDAPPATQLVQIDLARSRGRG